MRPSFVVVAVVVSESQSVEKVPGTGTLSLRDVQMRVATFSAIGPGFSLALTSSKSIPSKYGCRFISSTVSLLVEAFFSIRSIKSKAIESTLSEPR